MKKIGLLSIHSAHNYGSVLQAYALMNVLLDYSEKVEIIDYRPEYLQSQYKMLSLNIYKNYKGFKKLGYFIYRTINLYPRYKKYSKFEKFMKYNYQTNGKKYKTYDELFYEKFDFDSIVCGSDQIWNTDITNGFDKSYYLGFLKENCKKISYAASLGRKEIDTAYFNDYKKYLGTFDKISLRESSTLANFEKIGIKEVSVVLDPTLLIEASKWEELSKKSVIKKIREKYILVYRLERTKAFDDIVNYVQKQTGFKIISLNKIKSYKNEKNFPECGPEDFLKLFKNADFIITNSFHGTVFSIIFKKKNIIVPNTTKPARMVDLANNLGLKDRVIIDADSLNINLINKEINYYNVFERLEILKKESRMFLEEALNA